MEGLWGGAIGGAIRVVSLDLDFPEQLVSAIVQLSSPDAIERHAISPMVASTR